MPHHWYRGFRIPDPEELRPLPLVARDQWGALPPTEVKTSSKTFKTVAFAFDTGMETCLNEEHCTQAVKELQKKHMDQGHPDIFYHFAIGGDGRVYEGRGWSARNDDASLDVKNGRTLFVGIVGKGVDNRGNWFPPYERATVALVEFGVKSNYILEKKCICEINNRIEDVGAPVDTYRLKRLRALNVHSPFETDKERIADFVHGCCI